MQNGLSSIVKNNLSVRRYRKKWQKIICVLMAIVVFITTYALILPALTLENNAVCGMEEHTHTDSCYVTKTVSKKAITCNPGEDVDFVVHEHDDYCYDEDETLICELTERSEHKHSDDCYDEDGNLTCEKTEVILHTHSDDCYDDDGVLTCGKPQIIEHQHDDSCFEEVDDETQVVKTAVCGYEEHEHTDDCFEKESTTRSSAKSISKLSVSKKSTSTTLKGNYFKRIDSVDELDTSSKYVFLFANGSVLLRYSSGYFYGDLVDVQPIKGNPEYFNLASSSDTSVSITPTNSSSNFLSISKFSSGTPYLYVGGLTIYFDRVEESNVWNLDYYSSSYSAYRYLTYPGTGTSIYATSSSNLDGEGNIQIFKYVENVSLEIEDDITDSSNVENSVEKAKTKPQYSPYLAVSDYTEKFVYSDENDVLKNTMVSFSSDAATSQIENYLGMVGSSLDATEQYENQLKNDGELYTDKTVLYGKDDYGAYSEDEYDDYEFSVTLSALGQEYLLGTQQTISTPLDVVFIYDNSGSMKYDSDETSSTSNTRWQDSADAINNAIGAIMENNSDNRIGVVAFSNTSEDVLPLGRYYTNDPSNTDKTVVTVGSGDNEIKFSKSKYNIFTYDLTKKGYRYSSSSSSYVYQNVAYSSLQTSSYLYDGYTKKSSSYKDFHFYDYANDVYTGTRTNWWGATNTQAGIEQAYNMLKEREENDDTYVTYSLSNGKTVNVKRQPIIILVTDGDPTFGTYNYMDPLSGPTYGCGYPAGMLGYYTILSANYFKNLTSIAYDKKALFYTIGMGIKPTGNGNYYEDSSGSFSSVDTDSAYCRTILNPVSANISALDSHTPLYSTLTGTTKTKAYRLWERTNLELKNLLLQTGGSSEYGANKVVNVNANAATDSAYSGYGYGIGYTAGYLAGTDNPYLETGFAYADNAFFGNLDGDKMTEIFGEILDSVQVGNEYGFLLKEGTNITITDYLGEGMEVKGTPVLRYFGTNYSKPTRTVETQSNGNYTITYVWEQTVKRQESDAKVNNTTVDLSAITLKIYYYAKTGKQVVQLTIPEEQLPTLYPNLDETFYYEELPVRAIFKVGLTDETIDSINDSPEEIDTSYYTNDPNNRTTTRFYPAEDNPYYKDYSNGMYILKSINYTGTAENVFEEYMDDDEVEQYLGNNGEIALYREAQKSLEIYKRWNVSTQDSKVDVELYASGYYYDKNDEKHTFTKLYDEFEITKEAEWLYYYESLPNYEDIGDYTYYYEQFWVREKPSDEYIASYSIINGGGTLTPEKLKYEDDNGKTQTVYAVNVTTLSDALVITNSKSYALPGTGGDGTYQYTIVGIAFMALSGFMYFNIYKRKKNRKKGGEG